RDDAVRSWNEVISESVGIVDTSILREISPERAPDWGGVRRWLRSALLTERAKEEDSTAVTLWSNKVVIPVGFVLLLLPALFGAVQCAVYGLDIQRRVALMDLAKLDMYAAHTLHVQLG